MILRNKNYCSRKESYGFIIMDFEFSIINHTSMVVISGAISNSLDRFKVRKLEGRPLLLLVDQQFRPMRDQELQVAKKEIKRIFRCKEILKDVFSVKYLTKPVK